MDLSGVAVHWSQDLLSYPELRDVVSIAARHVQGATWYVVDLECISVAVDPDLERVQASVGAARMSEGQLARLADQVLQTIDCTIVAFDKPLTDRDFALLEATAYGGLTPRAVIASYRMRTWALVGPPEMIDEVIRDYPTSERVPAGDILATL